MKAQGGYRELRVWQDGVGLTREIYLMTGRFPGHEQFGLVNQLRRAAVSIPSNIAEGQVQASSAVFARHLQIAIGSAAEIDTQLTIAHQLGYLNDEQVEALQTQAISLLKRLRSLHQKILTRP